MAACLNSDLNASVLQAKLFGTSNWRLKSEIGTGMIPRELINAKSAVTPRGDKLDKINIKHISGGWSELYFRAYSQGREAAQGVEADVILIDEQPKDDFWSECLTRLATTKGHAICSFTPLEGRTGLVQELLDLKPAEGSPSDHFGAKYKEENRWSMVRASWDDVTHIDSEDKLTIAKGYADYERDARTFGIPIAGHGAIFPHLTGLITYEPRETQIRDTWPHLLGVDLGHGYGRDPSAVVMTAWDEENDIIYVTDCKLAETNTTKEMARLITSVNHTVPVAWPNDANRSSMASHSTVADQLREFQVNLLGKPFLNPRGADGKRNNHKAPGIKEMNQRFTEGRLLISTECTELLKQLEEYAYDKAGKIQDGNDDIIDACRYAIMSIIQDLGASVVDDGWGTNNQDDEFHWNSY